MTAPAGWYPDPENAGYQRRWTGEAWTDDRQLTPPVVLRRRGPGPIGIVGIALGWLLIALGVLGIFTVTPGSIVALVGGIASVVIGSIPRPPVVDDGRPRPSAALIALFVAAVAFIVFLVVLIVFMLTD